MPKKNSFLLFMAILFFLSTGCSVTLKHTPSKSLDSVKLAAPAKKILVVDIGDSRQEEKSTVGYGFSYWLPITYWSSDDRGTEVPVSFYLASSLNDDLKKVGYASIFGNQKREPMAIDDAKKAARDIDADYLITTKVKDAKTNYWGYIIIPFFQPVWTRVGLNVEIHDMRTGQTKKTLNIQHKETEWYFGKILILDAIFDAGIFGSHWHRVAWGETVVSDALAQAVQQIIPEIN